MQDEQERVILVSEQDDVVGEADKLEAIAPVSSIVRFRCWCSTLTEKSLFSVEPTRNITVPDSGRTRAVGILVLESKPLMLRGDGLRRRWASDAISLP